MRILQDANSYDAIVNVGQSADTLSASVRIELSLEESDDDAVFTAVADADVIDSVSGAQTGTFAVIDDAAEDEVLAKAAYNGSKRYVRVAIHLVGANTSGTPIAVAHELGYNEANPADGQGFTADLS